LGLRPVANAFGMSVGTIAIRGIGRPAVRHRRCTIACTSGASLSSTMRARAEASAILSDVQYWTASSPPAITITTGSASPTPCRRTTKKIT
jgi:hypothetical protein